jgi:hypothetical protein
MNYMCVVSKWFEEQISEVEVEANGQVKLSAEGARGSLAKRVSSISLNSRGKEPVARHMPRVSNEV